MIPTGTYSTVQAQVPARQYLVLVPVPCSSGSHHHASDDRIANHPSSIIHHMLVLYENEIIHTRAIHRYRFPIVYFSLDIQSYIYTDIILLLLGTAGSKSKQTSRSLELKEMSSPNEQKQVTSLQSYQIDIDEDLKQYLAKQYGSDDHVKLILDAMKRSPKTSTIRANHILSSTDMLKHELEVYLSTWMSKHDGKQDLKLQVFTNPVFSDVICVEIDSESNNTLDNLETPTVNSISLFDSWPLREQEGWPMTHRVVVCDVFCGEAVLRGSDIFVRGIMAADQGIRKDETVAVYVYVGDGKLRKGQKVVGEVSVHKTTNEVSNQQFIYLGLGRTNCKRSDFFRLSEGLAIEMLLDRVGNILPPLSNTNGFLQNLPSILVSHCLELRPSQTILDMCAAPGGKTCHVASLVANKAVIVACDKSRRKVLQMQALFRKEGATCIIPLVLDTTACCLENHDEETQPALTDILSSASTTPDGILDVKCFSPSSFDRILLDAPCSALGLRPKLRMGHTTVKGLVSAANYQKKFVDSAVSLLKPGGIMTYSTCTIHALENEGIVRYLLDEYPGMRLMPIEFPIGLPGLSGYGLDKNERECVRRFDPADTDDTIGFFVAKFQKASN